MEKLETEAASQLNAELRRAARGDDGGPRIDLSDPAHAYTVWIKNGLQGWVYVGSGANQAEINRVAGAHILHDPVILEVSRDADMERDKVVTVKCGMG